MCTDVFNIDGDGRAIDADLVALLKKSQDAIERKSLDRASMILGVFTVRGERPLAQLTQIYLATAVDDVIQ